MSLPRHFKTKASHKWYMREDHGNDCGINIYLGLIPKILESSWEVKIGSLVDMLMLIKKQKKHISFCCLSSVYPSTQENFFVYLMECLLSGLN